MPHLRKSRKILFNLYALYMKRKKRLLPAQIVEIEAELKQLEQAILNKESKRAKEQAERCSSLAKTALKKSVFEQVKDSVFTIGFALLFALLIRQIWFELYEIPTGSMRPTFKEKDRLIVSKTSLGINVPFFPKHFYFDPALVMRGRTIVFTTENMDVRDANTLYFYFLPGKKQFVKRLIGKPGDTLYFYGGKIYGIDREGRDISSELQLPQLASIDHVPFIRFEGNVKLTDLYHSSQGEAYRNAILYQMNEPVALLSVRRDQRLEGEMLNISQIRNPGYPPIRQYGDLWGIKNYATARLVSSEQIKSSLKKMQWTGDEGMLFLELRHSPNLNAIKLSKDQWGRLRPRLELSRSYLPLNEAQLRNLFAHLYTARFVVKNGFAARYSVGEGGVSNMTHFLPKIKGVPDGTYEFYDGVGYQIKWGGLACRLNKNHPLMQFSIPNIQLFFNLGIHFDTRVATEAGSEWLDTERFAYFRNEDFYVMGVALAKSRDPLLSHFFTREEQKGANATTQAPYFPFIEPQVPTIELIKEYGLRVPEGMYFVLGDNFAMSADSRDFGFVPAENLRGTPLFIFWPFGSRFGPPNQPAGHWFTIPNALIWTCVGTLVVVWRVRYRRKYKLPLQYTLNKR